MIDHSTWSTLAVDSKSPLLAVGQHCSAASQNDREFVARHGQWNVEMFGLFKKKQPPPNPHGPDFSPIDSRAKADDLLRKGQLEKLLLLPLEFGGEDVPENMVYVPVGLAGIKSGIDVNIIGPLLVSEKVTQYSAVPQYVGNSFIPVSIQIRAWDPEEFSTSIQIWGEGLTGTEL